jgi:aspartate-semialdehyde dehydrogenase
MGVPLTEACMMNGSMLDVAIVGATGIVGQQFVAALDQHPWFRISCLAASEKSAGKTYEEALRDPDTGALRWYCSENRPDSVLHMTMQDASALDLSEVDIVFTALDSGIARTLDPDMQEPSRLSALRPRFDTMLMSPS